MFCLFLAVYDVTKQKKNKLNGDMETVQKRIEEISENDKKITGRQKTEEETEPPCRREE